MRENTLAKCNLLVANKEQVKAVFEMENGQLQLAGACFFTMKSENVTKDRLQGCKRILKNQVGIFSNFRGNVRVPITCMLAEAADPETALQQGLKAYEVLKRHFMTSDYLPFVSMVIAKSVPESRYEEIAARSKEIYRKMKADHPILTSSEDSAFCALMALADRNDDALVAEAETCFRLLKPEFASENAVQSLSHVLALCEGTAEDKCRKTVVLYQMLKKARCKFGTTYELPTLGILATSGGDLQTICNEMIETEQWLANQKGFGFWSSIDRKTRLMYAGMLVQLEYIDQTSMSAATVNATLSMVIAQQVAICACIAASAASSAASGS